jgi:predicted nucleic acid-binding protein
VIRHIAAIDTNVILDILDTTETPASVDRRTRIGLTLEALRKERARFVVPSPVVAELCRGLRGSEVVRELAKAVLRGVRVEALDLAAAEVAGRIADVLVPGKKGLERGAVKYDALIAGLAHHIDARWLVTSNVRDLKTCLDAINSNVKVVNPIESFTRQGVLVQLMRPPIPAPPPAPATADTVDDPVE